MTDYWRPIPEEGGDLPLAGGWLGFSRVELLKRGAQPQILEAGQAPDGVLERLTARRLPVCGIAMDRPSLMGIVNVTPDSFSDGGSYDGIAQGRNLAEAGAAMLDIGGESTRPGAADISVPDEISRVVPVIEALRGTVPISVDTRKAGVADAALAAGAVLVNDVSGFDFDPDLPRVVAERGAGLCLMHAQGVPATMQDDPHYEDVLLDVYDALEARVSRAVAGGIRRERIMIDPGIGFGKTLAHNLAILARISLFHGIGCPILLGISRKRFIGSLAAQPDPRQRDPGSLAVTLAATGQGVQMHRVHDVATAAQGLALWNAVTGRMTE
ncbi:dihydropteroate synthase [Paracoccus aerodenitrificans]|uniref:dihydropteroate synthase n=1 Tax=Paracoccus aerodenitrificans TaxID=3017781 RepID=UPI0022F089ED|nr:dihydropteroate synthase [Paracoccus aerodenitrificans]WBU65022.1 dihydropteroate synthase [Paracoccus aerodenitrificans]